MRSAPNILNMFLAEDLKKNSSRVISELLIGTLFNAFTVKGKISDQFDFDKFKFGSYIAFFKVFFIIFTPISDRPFCSCLYGAEEVIINGIFLAKFSNALVILLSQSVRTYLGNPSVPKTIFKAFSIVELSILIKGIAIK